MENEVVLLDTSILIEYYRKKDKSKSALFGLLQTPSIFAVSAVTHFEIYTGSSNEQSDFWNEFFQKITVLPFNAEISIEAANIDAALKKKRKQIAIPDLFIAATAIHHNIPLVTLNKKHFERVDKIQLVEQTN
ncbi:type II toxin-antitoxin system VapC family toxin [Mucilaginibacter sp. McL0603]|uniref:type II toxin-antitoxin system VapC family toxin n=1 Tax=Mucilaginibacter sp. McL0603 TaxID=3415670 RepID=UPI003CE6933A